MGTWLGRMPWAYGGLLVTAAACAAPPSADQLRGWVSQLDADDFSVREAAGQNLVAAGEAAVEALSGGIVSSSPEAAWRASSALEQIALRGDDTVLRRVAAALERLSQRGKPGLSGVVKELHAKQAKLRHDGAVATIRSLGGKFDGEESDESGARGELILDGAALPIMLVEEAKLGIDLPDEAEKPGEIPAIDPARRASDKLPDEPRAPDAIAPPPEPSLPPDLPPPAAAPPAEVEVIAPPPDLPAEVVAPAAAEAPVLAFAEVFIADAFAPPGVLEPAEGELAEESLTIDKHWRGGNTGLSLLADLPELTSLSLHRAPLTDAALERIAALPQLKSLDIEFTSFSFEALTRFRERRPQTRVFARGQAMLGVNADMSGQCVLTGVYAGSGAAEAGLKEGDEIVAVAGHKVRDFSDLTIVVFSHRPGQKLSVEFNRNDQKRTAQVLLKERKLLEGEH